MRRIFLSCRFACSFVILFLALSWSLLCPKRAEERVGAGWTVLFVFVGAHPVFCKNSLSLSLAISLLCSLCGPHASPFCSSISTTNCQSPTRLAFVASCSCSCSCTLPPLQVRVCLYGCRTLIRVGLTFPPPMSFLFLWHFVVLFDFRFGSLVHFELKILISLKVGPCTKTSALKWFLKKIIFKFFNSAIRYSTI